MPVEIEGLKGLPMAGDDITVVDSEERARMLSEGRRRKFEKDRLKKIIEGRTENSELSEEVPERVEMPFIVKADVQGTVQAATDALRTLNSPQNYIQLSDYFRMPLASSEYQKKCIFLMKPPTKREKGKKDAVYALMVFVNVVHVGVGPISQSDVDLAQACGACIVGFNVKSPPSSVNMAATRASIKIMLHRVIYHLLEDIGNLIVEKAPGTSET